LLDKAGPNGIAPLAGMKGNLLPRLGITTHEYYLSDRLSEARTQSVAGRNKIESLWSIDHKHIFVGRYRASARLPFWFRAEASQKAKNLWRKRATVAPYFEKNTAQTRHSCALFDVLSIFV
jgi:hypothetical protein